jgi:hypothetical protein
MPWLKKLYYWFFCIQSDPYREDTHSDLLNQDWGTNEL